MPSSETATSQTNNVTKPPAAAPGDITMPPLPPPAAAVAGQEKKPLSKDEKQTNIEDELKKQFAASKQSAPLPIPGATAVSVPPSAAPGAAVAQVKDSAQLPVPPAPDSGTKAPAEVAKAPASPMSDTLALPPAPSPIGKEEKLPPAPVPPSDATSKGPLAPSDPQAAPALPNQVAPASAAVALGPKGPDSPLGEHSGQRDVANETQGARAPRENSLTPLPVGAVPGGTSAPIAIPVPPAAAAGAAPRVQSYDTEMHACKESEKTFADLSKALYGSEKYAPALLQFNRENPVVGDSFRDDSPMLKKGQQVVVPPTWVLEQERYAKAPPPRANPAPAPAPPPVTAAPVPVTPPSRPAAAAAAPPASVNSNPAPKNTAQAGAATYTVRGNGEMLYEIARQTLGDGKRWSEIYRLNPEIRPELAIPGGTQLRLPTDARVGS
jgi:hypothetical protein